MLVVMDLTSGGDPQNMFSADTKLVGIVHVREQVVSEYNEKVKTTYTVEDMWEPLTAFQVCEVYLKMQVEEFKKREKKEATMATIFCIWVKGPNSENWDDQTKTRADEAQLRYNMYKEVSYPERLRRYRSCVKLFKQAATVK
jgi:hypothetical protein